jgi:hypothetical protein
MSGHNFMSTPDRIYTESPVDRAARMKANFDRIQKELYDLAEEAERQHQIEVGQQEREAEFRRETAERERVNRERAKVLEQRRVR